MKAKRAIAKVRSYLCANALTVRLGLALVFTLAIVESLVVWTAYHGHMNAVADRLMHMVETAVLVSTNPLKTPTVEDLEFVGRRLVMQQTVSGGFVVDENNKTVGQFGIILPTSALVKAGPKRQVRENEDGNFFDLRFDGINQGLGYDLVVRIDRRPFQQGVVSVIVRDLELTGLIFALGIAIVFLAAIRYVSRPLGELRDRVLLALGDLENANHHLLRWSRSDEIGAVANSVDRLLRAVSGIRQEQIEAARTFLSHSSLPFIAFRNDGHFEFANSAAVAFFNLTTMSDFAKLNWPVVAVGGNGKLREKPLFELLDDQKPMRIVKVKAGDTLRPVQIIHVRHRPNDGERALTMVALIDVGRYVSTTMRLKSDFDKAEMERQHLSDLAAYQAFRLQGIVRLALTEDPKELTAERDSGGGGTPWPVRHVRTWHEKAREKGIVTGSIDFVDLPGIAIPPYLFYEALDRIFYVLLSALGHMSAEVAVYGGENGKGVEISFAVRHKDGLARVTDTLQGVQEDRLSKWIASIGGRFNGIDNHDPVLTATVCFPPLHNETSKPRIISAA